MHTFLLTGFFHFTGHKNYLEDPSKLKRTKSWLWLLACPDSIHTIQKARVSPKYCSPGSPLRSLLKQSETAFSVTGQTLLRAATRAPGRQDKSHAGRPKGICSGFPIWVGFPPLSQVSSKRCWNMPNSSQLSLVSLHPALGIFSHLDRNSRTYRISHLYTSI